MKHLVFAVALVVGCQGAVEEDGANDSFLDNGKSDTGGIAENSSPGYAVMRVANEATFEDLDVDAELSALTAENIIAYRKGPDGQPGTSDDERFDTLAELDAVPYVGPVAFQKLLDHAMALGYIVFEWRTHVVRAGISAANPTLCMVTAPADAKELKLMFDIAQSQRWRIDIRNSSHTLVQSIYPTFQGWSDPVPGNRATYAIFDGETYLDCKDFQHLLQAIVVREPVATDDPFRCTTQIALNPSSSSTILPGLLGTFALPNLFLLRDYAHGVATSCGQTLASVRYTAPTDGLYTFASIDNRSVAVLDNGCEGPQLACGGPKTSVKLLAGQSIALGINSLEPKATPVWVSRALDEVSCDDGLDDNGNGDVDCDDTACADECRANEACTNGIDDDADGLTDCLDYECSYDTSCSSNTCPGVDLASATSTTGPVAGGSGLLSPAGHFLSCGSTAVPWQGSRYYSWRAPAAGTYRFSISGTGLYDYGVKLLDGTCDGDVLSCTARSLSSTGSVTRTFSAGQAVVIEVGLSRYATDDDSRFTLSIRPQ